jgi:hypothetical protein
MKPAALLAIMAALTLPAGAAQSVAVLTDDSLPAPARYGLARLEAALKDKGVPSVPEAQADWLVLAGLAARGAAATALARNKIPPPEGAEAFVIHRVRTGRKPALILCGADARGLMYAALEVARRVAWRGASPDAFADVRDVRQSPFIRERAVSIYTMHRAYFESRLYDERYWRKYFDLLAASRINSFVVIFGYENGGFMAPPYPYFFDVESFPEVRLTGITPKEQQRNVAAFRKMIELAHERGIAFTAAIWDHIYRGGVQAGGIPGASELAGKPVPGLVAGLTAQNLAPYTKAALEKFLSVFPEIDGLQFRMHSESGLKPEEMQGFWREVFTLLKRLRPDLRVDLRAKDLPDAIIEDALAQGLRVRVATKFWMEQMGLPFHPTHINVENQHDRRHGYADLLRYPQRYRVHWRLWNGGATRLLLWGDPEYVRMFVRSARLYGGDSFEVNEMLATKMLGEPHEAAPLEILNPRYRYYDYEFERYWHFYDVWGLVAYDPETPAETWEREFRLRFGDAGRHLMEGLHLASRVVPRIVAASYRYQLFPTTRGWAEMMRIGDLREYAEGESSDIQQFLSPSDEARRRLDGGETAMRRPEETSRWFEEIAARILDETAQAEKLTSARTNEFLSTVTDLKILAHLARYHAARLRAGVTYNLYRLTGDLFAFDDALRFERQAVKAWKELVEAAGDVYRETLAFGVHRVGFPRHWREELAALERGLARLEAERRQARRPWTGAAAPRILHVPVGRIRPGEPLRVRATIASDCEPSAVRISVGGGAPMPMRRLEPGMYVAEIPLAAEAGRVPYQIETAGAGGARAAVSGEVLVSEDDSPPTVRLQAAATAKPGRPFTVRAEVSDPSGVKWVRLRYRHVTQFEDYQSVPMQLDRDSGLWEGSVPGEFIVPQWDLMYFIEALDQAGNGRIYPDLESEIPYRIVPVERTAVQ